MEHNGMGLVGVILGAFVALSTSFGLRIWQNERERWVARVDDFCETLDAAAELAVEFWLEVGTTENATKDQKREIQILGFQSRLDGLLEAFGDKLSDNDKEDISNKLANLRV
jgi:hypothetical protein